MEKFQVINDRLMILKMLEPKNEARVGTVARHVAELALRPILAE